MAARKLKGAVAGSVLAVVIDQDEVKRTGVVLLQQGLQAAFDSLGFVARGDHRDGRWPGAGRLGFDQMRVEELVSLPEVAMKKAEVDPREERAQGEADEHGVDSLRFPGFSFLGFGPRAFESAPPRLCAPAELRGPHGELLRSA